MGKSEFKQIEGGKEGGGSGGLGQSVERAQESHERKRLCEKNGTKGSFEMREATGLIRRKGEKVSCLLFFFFFR